MAEADAAETAITQREAQATEQSERAQADTHEAAMAKARDTAERDVISARENAMAGAAVLLALAVLGLGAGGLLYSQGRERRATWWLAGGGVLLFAAIGLFFLTPSFSRFEDPIQMTSEAPLGGKSVVRRFKSWLY